MPGEFTYKSPKVRPLNKVQGGRRKKRGARGRFGLGMHEQRDHEPG